MSEKIKIVYEGSSLPTILTVVFVIAKLLGYISWSWWWVFSPILITAGAGLLISIVAIICGIVVGLLG